MKALVYVGVKLKIDFSKGSSIKDVRTKSRKIDPLPICPQKKKTFSVRTHHKFRKILSVLSQEVRTSALDKPPLLTADVFYGQPISRQLNLTTVGFLKRSYLVAPQH